MRLRERQCLVCQTFLILKDPGAKLSTHVQLNKRRERKSDVCCFIFIPREGSQFPRPIRTEQGNIQPIEAVGELLGQGEGELLYLKNKETRILRLCIVNVFVVSCVGKKENKCFVKHVNC